MQRPQPHRKNYHTFEGQTGLQVQQVHICTGKITIHLRDRQDFRCSKSTAERKITIHVRDRGGLQVQEVHSCTENYHTCDGQGRTSGAAGTQLNGKLPYM